jgi:2-oxoglutarate ferredoxin oxidoreductase subunit beta
MDTYGMHGIHGRAPALATGLAAARDDLSIWVITGDGDALSIGGNHLIHALRRNVPVKILMFNNQIYGLTKGQASPTSELGKVTKSTPFGAHDEPFNPLALALGAGATFAARTIDRDRVHMTAVLRAAAEHRGTAFVEIYQNCPVFNDGAFAPLTDKQQAVFNRIPLQHGEPIRFGPDCEHGVVRAPDGGLVVAAGDDPAVVTHDAHRDDPTQAFALARLADSPSDPTPIGVFRAVDRPVGIAEAGAKLAEARHALDHTALDDLLHAGDTWTVAG